MADVEKLNRIYGVTKAGTDVGLITSGTVAFVSATQSLTVELKTAGFSFNSQDLHPDSLFTLVVEKPGDDTTGDLTIKTYNCIKVDGTNERDALIATNVIASTAVGTNTGVGCFLLQGLGIGGSFKLGMSWTADTGAINAYYKLYRV